MTKHNDLTSLFAILAFCVLMFPAVTIFVETTAGDEISPRFWPYIALVVSILGVVVAVYKSFKDGNKLNSGEFVRVSRDSKKQLLFVLMAIIYIKAMEYVGFLVASLIMLPSLMFYFGYRSKVYAPIIAVIFIGVLYLLFSKVFRISFPSWILGV